MGEHPEDKPYDQICDEIMAERAALQAQKEAEALRCVWIFIHSSSGHPKPTGISHLTRFQAQGKLVHDYIPTIHRLKGT